MDVMAIVRVRPRWPFFENEGLISVKSNFANGIPKRTYMFYLLTLTFSY